MAGSLIAGSDIRGYLRRVTAAREIAAKSSEIPAFAPLLADIDDEHLRGAVVTMDALHAQRDHAACLVGQRHAHYLVTVKGNQPNLSKQLRALPWEQVPVVHRSHDVGHGREEHRELQAVTVHDLLFPHARQVLRITRRRRALGARRWTTETVYAITDLAWEQATARELAEWARGHWTTENSVHWVRDITFAEDAHQLRTGHAPAVLAGLRDIVRGASTRPAGPTSQPAAEPTSTRSASSRSTASHDQSDIQGTLRGPGCSRQRSSAAHAKRREILPAGPVARGASKPVTRSLTRAGPRPAHKVPA